MLAILSAKKLSKPEFPLHPEWLDYYISGSARQPKKAFILQ
jgi:hypothetical protein